MTPKSHSTHPVDDTEELLGRIAGDTLSQLRRWIALSAFLNCPLILTSESRKEVSRLANSAVCIARAMFACTKEAKRCFRKRRFDRCMRELDRLEGLRITLDSITRAAVIAIVRTLFGRGRDGRRH